MKIMNFRVTHCFLAAAMVSLPAACSKTNEKKVDDGDSDQSETVAGTLAVGEDLVGAYPDSLAIAVFPEEIDTEAATGTIAVSLVAEDGQDGRSVRKKILDQKKFLTGQGESCLPDSLKERSPRGEESCYNFDQDMMYGSMWTASDTQRWNGTVDGKNSAGEACLVAFARTEVDNVVSLVEQTTGFVQAAICQSKKDHPKVGLPAGVGDSLDLKESLVAALGKRAREIKSAEMVRMPDVDSRTVFKTTIVVIDVDGQTRTIEIAHSPAADGSNDTYNGRITLLMDGDVGGTGSGGGNPAPSGPGPMQPNPGLTQVGLQGPGQGSKNRVLSVQYARVYIDATSEYRIRYELRTARMVSHIATEAIANGILDLNTKTNSDGKYLQENGTPYNQANMAASAIRFVAFDMNPDTNEGTLSYWQNPGGSFSESARGMVFNLSHSDDGTYKGCAISGAAGTPSSGLSIRMALKDSIQIKPVGFYHPMLNKENLQGCQLNNDADTDSTGTYYKKTCTQTQADQTTSTQYSQWYVPKLADSARATEFVEKQTGALVTRQCYKQIDTGVYEIDASEITEDAGYELIQTTSAKFIAPPKFDLPPPPPPAGR